MTQQFTIPHIPYQSLTLPPDSYFIGTKNRSKHKPLYGASFHVKADDLKSAIRQVRSSGCSRIWSLFLIKQGGYLV